MELAASSVEQVRTRKTEQSSRRTVSATAEIVGEGSGAKLRAMRLGRPLILKTNEDVFRAYTISVLTFVEKG